MTTSTQQQIYHVQTGHFGVGIKFSRPERSNRILVQEPMHIYIHRDRDRDPQGVRQVLHGCLWSKQADCSVIFVQALKRSISLTIFCIIHLALPFFFFSLLCFLFVLSPSYFFFFFSFTCFCLPCSLCPFLFLFTFCHLLFFSFLMSHPFNLSFPFFSSGKIFRRTVR